MTATLANGNGSAVKKTKKADLAEITDPVEITLTRIKRESVQVPIVGTTPLIMHNWSEKAKALMLEAQQSTKAGARKVREPKDPVADYEAAHYRLEDGRPGMPSVAFKAAITEAARFFRGVHMTTLKSSITVIGVGRDQLVPIIGNVRMREDTPRNATGVCDLRYRPEFYPWKATLHVEYMPHMIDVESIFALVDAAGANGVGDWRPSSPKSKTGTYGRWEVTE